MPDAITTTATFESVLDSLEAKNIAFQTPSIDSIFKLGNATIDILYVGTDDTDLNNTSIVLKLTYGNTSVLFMGDAEKEVETTIEKKDISADIWTNASRFYYSIGEMKDTLMPTIVKYFYLL